MEELLSVSNLHTSCLTSNKMPVTGCLRISSLHHMHRILHDPWCYTVKTGVTEHQLLFSLHTVVCGSSCSGSDHRQTGALHPYSSIHHPLVSGALCCISCWAVWISAII